MKKYIDTVAISHETALEAVTTAVKLAAEEGLAAAVTVVDPALGIVAYLRADGTTPHSEETSRRKATTSASTRKATGWMQGEFATALPLGTGGRLTNILGGVPIVFDGVLVGGLGVAGGPPDRDAEIAHATLAAIGADPVR